MKKYFYVVECVKLKEENGETVIDYTYDESTKLFESFKEAVDYYEEVVTKASDKLGFILIKVSAGKTGETLDWYTFEFNDKTYYYVNEIECSF